MMIVHILFLASFLAGLLALVMFMLFGVERHQGTATVALTSGDPDAWLRILAATQSARARIGLPGLAAFATLFGAVGYVLSRYTALSLGSRVAIAIAAGAAALTLAVVLVARWAIPSARNEVVDERFLLQGHFATVTASVPADGTGEIGYELEGVHLTAQARSLDGSAIQRDAEVVIERIEDGIAFVEPWVQVEQRI